jgi:hypothetical protein
MFTLKQTKILFTLVGKLMVICIDVAIVHNYYYCVTMVSFLKINERKNKISYHLANHEQNIMKKG